LEATPNTSPRLTTRERGRRSPNTASAAVARWQVRLGWQPVAGDRGLLRAGPQGSLRGLELDPCGARRPGRGTRPACSDTGSGAGIHAGPDDLADAGGGAAARDRLLVYGQRPDYHAAVAEIDQQRRQQIPLLRGRPGRSRDRFDDPQLTELHVPAIRWRRVAY